MIPHLNRIASTLLSVGLTLASNVALAQQPQPPAPPASAGQAPPPPRAPRGPMPDMSREYHGGDMHPGARIVPPGTWWRNPDMITALTLTADQQKKMDDILLQSRIELVRLKASLDEQQLLLEPMLNANPPDSAKSLAQIGRIADLRANLEKANAKMLLSIRAVLTADQWTKLQATGRGGRHMHGDPGPGGPPVGQGTGRGMGPGRIGGGGGHEYRASPPDMP
jgi:Spy/CpxP family protein refolding chaperone